MTFRLESMVEETEARLGRPPRSFGLLSRRYLHAKLPPWLPPDDRLRMIYDWQGELLRNGEVALGVIVQANELLFSAGEHDHPANVIYSTDHRIEDLLEALLDCADTIFSLKDTYPVGSVERTFAEAVTDEEKRNLRVTVPKTWTHGAEVEFTTLMVHRKHLPRRYLASGHFPLLVHPSTPATMIVPSRFWPEAILMEWR